MQYQVEINSPERVAAQIAAEMHALPQRDTPSMRSVRRRYSSQLKNAAPQYILALARELIDRYHLRWIAYELIAAHRAAFRSLGAQELEALGSGIDSWWTVDSFARTLSGPAWQHGQVPDALIQSWARSPDRWWRRAALVSTAALNIRSSGGQGDVSRTLRICSMLVGDHDDMVVKAMSWALRELVAHDPQAVRQFLDRQAGALAARVRREVTCKLETGLKNPRRKASLAAAPDQP